MCLSACSRGYRDPAQGAIPPGPALTLQRGTVGPHLPSPLLTPEPTRPPKWPTGQQVASVTQVPSRHSLMLPDLCPWPGVTRPRLCLWPSENCAQRGRAPRGSRSQAASWGPSSRPVLSCPSVGCVWVVVGEGRVRRAVRGGRCVGREAWEGPHCSERAAVMSGERWRRAPVRVGLVPEGGGAGWLPAGSSSTGATLGGRVGGGVCGASLVGWSVRRGDVSPAWPLPTRERSTAVVRPPVSRHCLAPLGAADSVQEQMQEDVGTSGWGCRHRDFPTICMRRFSWWVFVILGHVSCTGLRIPWGSRWGHIPSPPPASGHHLSVVCCFGNGA